jgi:hypothetical protein
MCVGQQVTLPWNWQNEKGESWRFSCSVNLKPETPLFNCVSHCSVFRRQTLHLPTPSVNTTTACIVKRLQHVWKYFFPSKNFFNFNFLLLLHALFKSVWFVNVYLLFPRRVCFAFWNRTCFDSKESKLTVTVLYVDGMFGYKINRQEIK